MKEINLGLMLVFPFQATTNSYRVETFENRLLKILIISFVLFPCVVWLDSTVPPPTVTFYEPCLVSELVLRRFSTARPNQSGKERYGTLDKCSLPFRGFCSNKTWSIGTLLGLDASPYQVPPEHFYEAIKFSWKSLLPILLLDGKWLCKS